MEKRKGEGRGKEEKAENSNVLFGHRLGSEVSPTDSQTSLMAKCIDSLQSSSDTYPVKEKAKVNLTCHPFSSSKEKEQQVGLLK